LAVKSAVASNDRTMFSFACLEFQLSTKRQGTKSGRPRQRITQKADPAGAESAQKHVSKIVGPARTSVRSQNETGLVAVDSLDFEKQQ
jgi:hypothetical protein